MVSIQPTTTSVEYSDDRPWLVFVERGDNETVTLDLEAFTTEHRDGVHVKSGIPITKNAGTGLFGPTAAAGTADGVLFVPVYAPTGVTRAAVASMTRGTVKGAGFDGITLPPTIRKVA